MNAGQLIRARRTLLGLSQLQLALRADTSSRHLSYIETGRTRPSRRVVLRLGEVLGFSSDELIELLRAAGLAPTSASARVATAAPSVRHAALTIGLDASERTA